MMGRALSIAQLVLPLALAGTAAVAWGEPGVAMALAALAAGLLGWALALTVGSVLTMAGMVSTGRSPVRHLRQLERDRLALQRAIRAIELDAAVQRLSPDEAEALAKPLREREERLLRELDEAREQGRPTSVADAIDRELERRLERRGSRQESAG